MSEPEPSRPGSILRAEREALGVSVREVSETLNLSTAIIEAIEADDHERLPGPVFARGYVRAYARLLELEPEPLVAQYPAPQDPIVRSTAPPELPIWEWIRRRPALVLGSAAGVLALLLVLLVVWLWPGGDGAPESVNDPVGRPSGQAIGGADAELEPFESRPPAADVPQGMLSPATPAADDFSAAADFAGVSAADSMQGRGTSPPDEAASHALPGVDDVRRITPLGEDRLDFSFTDDCWVEVRDGGGGNLYSNLSRRGSSLSLVGQGPFRILLGYAPGVEVSFNGELVPLAPHTRDNLATLVLGQ